MAVAGVIVDVPSRHTDRAFDYRIPAEWEDWIEVGSRVIVPFGPRLLQGFVVEVRSESEMDPDKLKPIAEVIDLVPPLTPELVELGRWMSDAYLCPEIIAMQAMLPKALKAKYKRFLSVGDSYDGATLSLRQTEVCEYIASRESVDSQEVFDRYPGSEAMIKTLIKQNILSEEQTVKDRLNRKRSLFVAPAQDRETLRAAIQQLPKSAKRQQQALAYVADNPEPVTLAVLTAASGVSSAAIRSLADKGLLTLDEREVLRDPYAGRTFDRTVALPLTRQQQEVFEAIAVPLEQRKYAQFLLHGVTGSGKTEVYLQAIQRCLRQEREAIALVPEISLTPQMVDRFKGRFGNQVAVLHSRLSDGERYDEWRRIWRGQVSVVVGARSAIFAPFSRLGLIIIDEEHESSYKQEDSPKYEAKAVARERAVHHGAVVVLGSATPSLESWRAALDSNSREIELLEITSRVSDRPMPEVRLVDMREELKAGNRSMFSHALHEGIRLRLERGEQIVLLLNRRGYSTFVLCRSCGYTASCPHCDIALTHHLNTKRLRCHYCGYTEREMSACPTCGSPHIRGFGTGTQRVEEQLYKSFDGIRVIRMDVDTTGEKGAHERLLDQFKDRKADVLLGTQMVAKGLDYPAVTLVGVIAADSALHLPDFRAVERTFQLVTQVAGRAGRHDLPGEVIVQTYNPDHYSMQAASSHDYRTFAGLELGYREQHRYPPYSKLILITLAHEKQDVLIEAGQSLVRSLEQASRAFANVTEANMSVLGPAPSPIPRLKDRYRYQCMVKYSAELPAVSWVRLAVDDSLEYIERHKVSVSVDVNPYNMM